MSILSKKTKLGLAAILATLLLPMTASADGKGLMLGGGLYYGSVSEKDDGFKIDDSSGAFNLDVGWRFNKWIALDAGYWELGDYKSDKNPLGQDFKTETSAWTAGGMVSVPIWIIDIYGRLGAAWWEANPNGFDKEDGTDAYYGLGLAFNLGGSLDIYGEWTRFDLNTDLDLFGLGVRWTF